MAEILLTVMTIAAFCLAALSVIISKRANKIAEEANEIAEQSDKKMTAIADSQIDEKLAMMAAYLADTDATLRNMNSGVVWTLNEIRKLNSDFYAVFDLKEYASDKKNEVLIKYYIIPILENLYPMKKRYQKDLDSLDPNSLKKKYPDYRIDHNEWEEWNKILTKIAEFAKMYGIETETIENISNELNAMRAKNEGV